MLNQMKINTESQCLLFKGKRAIVSYIMMRAIASYIMTRAIVNYVMTRAIVNYIMTRIAFWCDDDDVFFVLDQWDELGF